MSFKKLFLTLVALVISIPAMFAQAPSTLNAYVGTAASIGSNMPSSVKQTVELTSNGSGVFTGALTLNYTNGYYFVLGNGAASSGNISYYASTTTTQGGNPIQKGFTTYSDAFQFYGVTSVNRNVWYWGSPIDPEDGYTKVDQGEITVYLSVDFSTMKITVTDTPSTGGGGGDDDGDFTLYAAAWQGAYNDYRTINMDNSVALTYNESTKTYEGDIVSPTTTGTTSRGYLKLYSGTEGNYTYYGPVQDFGSGPTGTNIAWNFTAEGVSQNGTFGENTDPYYAGAWYSTFTGASEGNLHLVVSLENKTITATWQAPSAGGDDDGDFTLYAAAWAGAYNDYRTINMDNSVALTYNESTKTYEGDIVSPTTTGTTNRGYLKLYSGTEGNYTYYGPVQDFGSGPTGTNIAWNFTAEGVSQNGTFGENTDPYYAGAWYSTFTGASEGNLHLVVSLENKTITATWQAAQGGGGDDTPKVEIPSELYVYTGANMGIANQPINTAVRSTTALTQTSPGIFTGKVTLSQANGYYFIFGYQKNYYYYYGDADNQSTDNTGNPIDIKTSQEFNFMFNSDNDTRKRCWYWGPAKVDGLFENIGEIVLDAVLDFNTGVMTLTNETADDSDHFFTIKFEGAENGWQKVFLADAGTGQTIDITSNTVTVPYEGDQIFSLGMQTAELDEGWNFTLTGPNGEMGANGEYQIMDMGNDMQKAYIFQVTEGAYGYTFTANVTAPAPKLTNSVTVNFVGDGVTLDNVKDYVSVIDLSTTDEVDITGTSYVFEYGNMGGLNIVALDQEKYEVAITSSNPDLEGTAYTISGIMAMDQNDEVLDFGTGYTLTLLAAADGLTFTVTVKAIAPENPGLEIPAELNIWTGGNVSLGNQYGNGIRSTVNMTQDTPGIFTGQVKLNYTTGYYFIFGYKDAAGNLYYYGSANPSTGNTGVGIDVETTENFKVIYNGKEDSRNNMWYWAPARETGLTEDVGEVLLNAVLDLNTATLTLANVSDEDASHFVTINFTGANNGWQKVQIIEWNDAENVDVTSASVSIPYETTGQYVVAMGQEAQMEGWSFTLTGPEGDQVAGAYTITSMEDVMPGAYMLQLYEGAYGMSFTIDVKEPAPENSVTLNFVGNGVTLNNDVNKYVSILNMQADPAEEVTVSGTSYEYAYGKIGGLNFTAESGYVVKIESSDPSLFGSGFSLTSTAGSAEIIPGEEYDPTFSTNWVLSVWPAGKGLTFTVTIQPANYEEPDASTLYAASWQGAYNDYRSINTENAVALTYNADTKTYEGDVTCFNSPDYQNRGYLKLYSGTEGNYTYYGPAQDFGSGATANAVAWEFTAEGQTFNADFFDGTEVGKIGAWYTNFANASNGTLHLVVSLENQTITATWKSATVQEGEALYAAAWTGVYMDYKQACDMGAGVALKYNPEKDVYEGDVTSGVTKAPNYAYIKLYSTEDNVTTYYGPKVDYGSGLTAARIDAAFASEGSSFNGTFYDNTDVAQVGAWSVTQLGSATSGNIHLEVSLANNTIVMTYGEAPEEQDSANLYIAITGAGTSLTPVPSANDQYLTPSEADPNVYVGQVNIQNARRFFFYKKTADGNVIYGPNSSFSLALRLSDMYEDEDADADHVTFPVYANSTSNWYISNNGNAVQFNYDAVVNLNPGVMSATLNAVTTLEKPEELYLIGSTTGSERMLYQYGDAMLPSAENPDVYTQEFLIPECKFELIDDGEITPAEGDLPYGFYFVFSDSSTLKGQSLIWQAPFDPETNPSERVFTLTQPGEEYTATCIQNSGHTGGNFICVTPGYYKFSLNWKTNEFVAELIRLSDDTHTITLNFTGVEDAYKYVNVIDLNTTEAVNVTSNSYKFNYNSLAALNFSAVPGYKVTLSSTQPSNNGINYTIQNFPADEIEGTEAYSMLNASLMADGFVFNVNVEPANSVSFTVAGVPDAYKLVNVFDLAASDDELAEIVLTSPTFNYNYVEQGAVIITPQEGYQLAISSNGDEENYVAQPWYGGLVETDEEPNPSCPWIVQFGTEANGYQFTVTVSEVGENSVTVKFAGVEDAYKYVTMIDAVKYEVIEPTSDTYVYDYAVQGAIVFTAAEGYALEITSDGDAANWQVGPWDSGIDPMDELDGDAELDQKMLSFNAAANGYTFTVTVSEDSGVNRILGIDDNEGVTVYNFNGVLVLKSEKATDLNLLAPGMYIINGKKAVIR